MSYNKVILMGNLTKDPKLSYLANQNAVIEFSIALNRSFKKSDGTEKEEVCFVDCQMFGKRAEVINNYYKKGDLIFVEGRLKLETWDDKEGKSHAKIKLIVEDFQFTGKSGIKDKNEDQEEKNENKKSFIEDEDIPF
jgi:single-strand DNA-binding protein